MGHKSSRRLFLALFPPLSQRQRLVHRVVAACPELEAAGVRPVDVSNIHMTLVFLGSVTAEVQACIERVAAMVVAPAFLLHFDRLGYWSHRRMLWAMPNPERLPDALFGLVDALYQGLAGCDVRLEQRDYRPHVTLARQLGRGPRQGRIEPVDWALDCFVLMESLTTPMGVRYSVLRSWPLASC